MKTKRTLVSAILLTLAVIYGCKKNESTEPPSTDVLTNAPSLPERSYDYPNSVNDSLAELGRVLFYDKNLSLNNSVACGNCHRQTRAFCDNERFSTGLEDMKTPRNSPSIFSKDGSMFWDGRAGNFSELVFMPVQNHVEMKFSDLHELSNKISRIDYYRPLFKKVFRTETVDPENVRIAMLEFLKNFDFSKNKFARHQANMDRLTPSEENGKNIFFEKGRCFNCHHLGTGVQNGGGGGYGSVTPNLIFNIGLDHEYADKGVGERTGLSSDYGKFLVPVLLNVEYTSPYMHDGRFNSLEEVVEHYNSGIKNHANLDPQLRDFSSLGKDLSQQEILQRVDANHNGVMDPEEVRDFPAAKLGLSSLEKRDLIAFLKTLSDPSIFTDAKFSDPFAKK